MHRDYLLQTRRTVAAEGGVIAAAGIGGAVAGGRGRRDSDAGAGGVTLANGINSLRLLCDIIGAVLLWRYGLPERLSRAGHIYLIAEQVDEAEPLCSR